MNNRTNNRQSLKDYIKENSTVFNFLNILIALLIFVQTLNFEFIRNICTALFLMLITIVVLAIVKDLLSPYSLMTFLFVIIFISLAIFLITSILFEYRSLFVYSVYFVLALTGIYFWARLMELIAQGSLSVVVFLLLFLASLSLLLFIIVSGLKILPEINHVITPKLDWIYNLYNSFTYEIFLKGN